MSRIVVGVDTSEHATRALRWAVEEARLRDATLEVVHSFPWPEVTAMPAIITMPSEEELVKAAEAVVDEALASVPEHGEVEVLRTVRAGGAAGVLCRVAEGADLVVVGARGVGGFRGLLLGSVSQQVVAHAPCPAVVIGPPRP
ncbi:universal stress protein [Nitriliruptoraceae bacterium ZYF776]|nr:universal stress protein [Profundirhabdus halotolerans]